MHFLRFIRTQNLIIVAISQYLLRYCLIKPILKDSAEQSFWQNNEWLFALFVGMTVFAAAGGYIINDIIDEKIDTINKPKKQFVGVHFKSKTAYLLYGAFAGTGFLAAALLSFFSQYIGWLFYYTSASLLLFAYSKWLKQRALVGNIVVAVFTACVAWGIALPINQALLNTTTYKTILSILISYCLFAFLSNLWREIIKDIEDMQGDTLHGCRTLPIVLGIRKSKIIASIVALLLSLSLFFFIKNLFFLYETPPFGNTLPSVIWLICCVIFPVIYTLYLQYHAESKDDFHTISSFIKVIMLGGLLFCVVFKFFCQ